jgi:hypothetical protein
MSESQIFSFEDISFTNMLQALLPYRVKQDLWPL